MVAAIFLANVTTEVGLGIVMPMLPIFARNLGATGFLLGMIFGAYPLGRFLFTAPVATLGDYWDRRGIILGGLVLFTAASAGYLLADAVNLFIAMRFLQGVSGAAVVTISMAALGDAAPRRTEGRIMGLLQFALWGGFGLGPILGGTIVDWWGMSYCFVAMAGLGAAALALSMMIMPRIQGPLQKKQKADWGYRSLLRNRTMLGLVALTSTFSFTRGMTSAFLPLFGDRVLHLSGSEIGTIISINILLIGLIQWPAGKLADRGNRRLLSSACHAAGSLTIFTIAWVNNFWVLVVVILANSLFTGCALPAMYAMAVEEGRTHGMAQAMGIMTMTHNVGFIAGALGGGLLMDSVGIQLLFALGPIGGWIGVALFLWIVRETR